MVNTVFDHAKQSATDVLKTTSKRVIPKTVEATGDLIGNKIADTIKKVSTTLHQNIYIYIYIYPEKSPMFEMMI